MKKSYVNKIKFFIFILILTVSLIILVINFKYIKELDVKTISRFVRHKGIFSYLIYLGIFIIKPIFLILPANLVAIVGATLFGGIKGFFLAMTGFFLSATISFYLSRILGKDFVEGIIGDKLMGLDDKFEEHGFKMLLIMRLMPIIPYDPLSYACGFTKIKYRDFIFASLIGVLPETICYSMMGRNYSHPFSWKFIVPIILILGAIIISKKLMNSKKNVLRKENSTER